MKSILFFLMITISLSAFSQETLEEIANNYKYNPSKEYPMGVFYPYAEYVNYVKFAQFQVTKLNQLEKSAANKKLLVNLQTYYNDILKEVSQCKSYAWYMNIPGLQWPLNLLVYLDSENLDVFYNIAEEQMKNLRLNLISLEDKIDYSLEVGVYPTPASQYALGQVVWDQEGMFGLKNFIDGLEGNQCALCAQIDSQHLISMFDQHIKPQMQKMEFKAKELVEYSATENLVLEMPNSVKEECYDGVIESTYSNLTPEMILRKGEMELARAENSMLIVAQELGYSSLPPESLPAFIQRVFDDLSNKPEFMIQTEEDYRVLYEEYDSRVRSSLAQIVTRGSEFPLEYNFIFAPNAYPSQSGWYSFDPKTETGSFSTYVAGNKHYRSFELPALFFHEAIPGHHFDSSNKYLINKNKTKYEQEAFISAYSEGWGFYVEELVLEMGLYKSGAEVFGFWDFQRLRALRMILAYRYYYDDWSDEQAIVYVAEHLFGDEDMALSVISRPKDPWGQGLSYMVGKTVIQSLRESSQKYLGSCFNLAEFHDFYLDQAESYLDTVVMQTAKWLSSHQCYNGYSDASQLEDHLREDIKASFNR